MLIAAVRPNEFFAVDVVPHSSQNDPLLTVRPDLLSIIDRNWPTTPALLRPALSEMKLERSFGLEEQLRLRQAGVTVFTEVGGRVCLPGGIALDGTPMLSTQRAQKTMWLLHDCEQRRIELEAQAVDLARNLHPGLDAQPAWTAGINAEADLHLIYGGAVRFSLR